jgi:hypothetical protein
VFSTVDMASGELTPQAPLHTGQAGLGWLQSLVQKPKVNPVSHFSDMITQSAKDSVVEPLKSGKDIATGEGDAMDALNVASSTPFGKIVAGAMALPLARHYLPKQLEAGEFILERAKPASGRYKKDGDLMKDWMGWINSAPPKQIGTHTPPGLRTLADDAASWEGDTRELGVAYNLKNKKDPQDILGSMQLTISPQIKNSRGEVIKEARNYVNSWYVEPKLRGMAAISPFVQLLERINLPVNATFGNDKLALLAAKLGDRGHPLFKNFSKGDINVEYLRENVAMGRAARRGATQPNLSGLDEPDYGDMPDVYFPDSTPNDAELLLPSSGPLQLRELDEAVDYWQRRLQVSPEYRHMYERAVAARDRYVSNNR